MSRNEDILKGPVRRLAFGSGSPLPQNSSEFSWRLKTEAISTPADLCGGTWGWEDTESVSFSLLLTSHPAIIKFCPEAVNRNCHYKTISSYFNFLVMSLLSRRLLSQLNEKCRIFFFCLKKLKPTFGISQSINFNSKIYCQF